MGVLKVPVGGDWRKVGCGDGEDTIVGGTAAGSSSFSNGSAESGVTGWVNGSGTQTLTSSTDQAFVGTKSFKLTPFAGGSPGFDAAKMNVSPRFACTPGGFRFQARLRTTGCTAEGELTVAFWDSGGGFLSGGGVNTDANAVTAAGWTLMEGEIVAPAGTASADIEVGVINPSVSTLEPSNPVYIDDIAFTGAVVGGTVVPAAGRLRLRLPDGSWIREVCDDEPPVITETPPWHWVSEPAQVGVTVSYSWQASSTPSTGTAYFGMYSWLEWVFPDGTTGGTTGGSGVPYPGSVTALHTFSYNIPATATVTYVRNEFTHNGSDFVTVTTWGPPERHPLKIEDPANPGTWITVACFTPVPAAPTPYLSGGWSGYGGAFWNASGGLLADSYNGTDTHWEVLSTPDPATPTTGLLHLKAQMDSLGAYVLFRAYDASDVQLGPDFCLANDGAGEQEVSIPWTYGTFSYLVAILNNGTDQQNAFWIPT